MYSVEYSKTAFKALEKLNRPTAALLYGWIDKNLVGCGDPRAHGKALTGDRKGYWRYRIGDYRLIADIQNKIITINIINIAHRREVYDD